MTTHVLPEPALAQPADDMTQDQAPVDRQPLFPMLTIALAAVVAAVMLWSRRGYIPLWDGRIYADCVIDASQDLLAVGGFRCAEHISHGYVALLAVAQRLSPATPAPMLAMNAALLALGAAALHRITAAVFPSPAHALGRALVVAAFLVHPIVLASAVQPGLDFGLLVFTLCTLAAVIDGRRWAVVTFGLLLVFSKEPGVLLYGVLGALYLWRHALRHRVPTALHWLAAAASLVAVILNVLHRGYLSAILFALVLWVVLWRRPAASRTDWPAAIRAVMAQWMLATPLVAVFGYMAIKALVVSKAPTAQTAPVVWGNTGSTTLVATVFRAGVVDLSTISVLALMLVIGFLWIPTAVMAVDVAIGTARRRRGLPPREMPGVDVATLGVVTVALLGCIWFLSRYQTFSNARYYLPVYPLVLVVAYASLVRLGVSQRMRAVVFGAFILLIAISMSRTVDPVSRAVWGTFALGERAMLETTSLTGECCGAGRDQLVYNLEFTQIDALTSEALAAIHPGPGTTIVVPPFGDWHTIGQVDARTGRRTLARTGVVMPRTVTAPVAYQYASQIPEGWYLEMPYLDNSVALEKLAERFDVSAPARVEHDGYAMNVRRLRRKR